MCSRIIATGMKTENLNSNAVKPRVTAVLAIGLATSTTGMVT